MHVFVSGRHADRTTGHKDPKLLFLGGGYVRLWHMSHATKTQSDPDNFLPLFFPQPRHGQLVGGGKKISNFVSLWLGD